MCQFAWSERLHKCQMQTDHINFKLNHSDWHILLCEQLMLLIGEAKKIKTKGSEAFLLDEANVHWSHHHFQWQQMSQHTKDAYHCLQTTIVDSLQDLQLCETVHFSHHTLHVDTHAKCTAQVSFSQKSVNCQNHRYFYTSSAKGLVLKILCDIQMILLGLGLQPNNDHHEDCKHDSIPEGLHDVPRKRQTNVTAGDCCPLSLLLLASSKLVMWLETTRGCLWDQLLVSHFPVMWLMWP